MGVFVQEPNNAFDSIDTISYTLVSDRFADMTTFADVTWQATQSFIADLQSSIASLELPATDEINVEMPYVPELDYGARPTLGVLDITEEWPDQKPIMGTMLPVPELPDIDIPVFSLQAPTYENIERPNLDTLVAPTGSPDINIPDIPTAPAVSLPPPPSLPDIPLPDPPSIPLPEFNGELPTDTIITPDGFVWAESPYNSDIWDQLLDNVLVVLRDGGTGLGPAAQEAIWRNAQRRQEHENDKAFIEAEAYFAAKGHQLPPGPLNSRLMEIGSEIAKNNTTLNGEIAIEQARLAKEHMQFMVEKGIDLEKVLRAFHEARENRSLEAAKVVAESAISIFNSQVERYNLGLERYKTQASVYETRLKAAQTSIEIFKSQVESAQVSSEVQKNIILIYNAQIAAAETHVKIYTEQVRGAQVAAEIERLRIEAFKEETNLYVSRIKGQQLQVEMYRTQHEAEATKAGAYAEQVKAFGLEVDAQKSILEVRIAELNAILSANNITIEGYKGELSGYIAEIDAASKKTSAIVEGYKGTVQAYSAETDAQGAMYGAKIKEIDARIQQSRFLLEKAKAEIGATLQGYLGIKELEIKGTEGMVNVGAQLTSAAMNAVNANASVGSNVGLSESQSYGYHASLSETHSFNEE